MAPSIRPARPDELETAASVMVDAYREYAPGLPRPVWRAYEADIADVRSRLEESELLVAEDGGEIVGAVTFYALGSSGMDETWPKGWAAIRLLAVRPDARGRGVGRALVDECLRRARVGGATSVGLHTSERMTVARSMYRRMGFRRVPEYDLRSVPDVHVEAYALAIGPEEASDPLI